MLLMTDDLAVQNALSRKSLLQTLYAEKRAETIRSFKAVGLERERSFARLDGLNFAIKAAETAILKAAALGKEDQQLLRKWRDQALTKSALRLVKDDEDAGDDDDL